MRGPVAWCTAALAVLLVVPVATPAKDPPVEPGPDNSFGSVWVQPYPTYEDRPVTVEATFTMKNWSRVDEVAYVMLAFNVHNPTLKVEFTKVQGPSGEPVRLQQDRRAESTEQPKVFVTMSDLPPPGTPVHLTARVKADNGGGYHLGVLALAFDKDFDLMLTPDGYQAQVYWFTTVGSFGQDTGPLAPPFEGRGNTIPSLGAFGLLGAVGLALGLRRRVTG
jgi:hypothetical protein